MTELSKRRRLWTWLYAIRREYQALPAEEVDYDLWKYIEVNYGVRIVKDYEGMITGHYTVVDDEKFFMSKLSGADI